MNVHLPARSAGRYRPRDGQVQVLQNAAVGCGQLCRFRHCLLQVHEQRALVQHGLPLRIYFRPPSGNGPENNEKEGK